MSLDYICRVCYNYYLAEIRDLDIKCNRCMEIYDHRAVWPGSYSRGPLGYECLVSHWGEGICPVCEKFVVCLSDWINVSAAGEVEVYVCSICVANRLHPLWGATSLWKGREDLSDQELTVMADPEARNFSPNQVEAYEKVEREIVNSRKLTPKEPDHPPAGYKIKGSRRISDK